LIKILEQEIHLSRAIEYLPDDEIFDRRRSKGQGMTRPEFAVLLAYSKIALYNKIIDSNSNGSRILR
jgi:glutamate dehydrogenase